MEQRRSVSTEASGKKERKDEEKPKRLAPASKKATTDLTLFFIKTAPTRKSSNQGLTMSTYILASLTIP